MEALTSPLLKTPARHDANLAATDAELATIIELARSRRARDIAIGSGRTAHAIATSRAIETAWELANSEVPHFAHADEQLLYTFATQILRDQFVDTETFDAALAEWGEADLVDIIGCLGNFAMLAMLLNTFQVGLKAGAAEPFPDMRGFARVRPGDGVTRHPFGIKDFRGNNYRGLSISGSLRRSYGESC